MVERPKEVLNVICTPSMHGKLATLTDLKTNKGVDCFSYYIELFGCIVKEGKAYHTTIREVDTGEENKEIP